MPDPRESAETNPYAATSRAEAAPNAEGPYPKRAVFGMVIAALLGAIYLLVVAASVYECVNAPAGYSIDGYLREGTFSAAFAVICGVTVHQFRMRRNNAGVWLMACPLLIVIFVYPGTYAVLRFFRNIFDTTSN